ncbi:cupin domain-containing protein [Burkholderia gladioli]|uniref:cupin domain-containing protein n=1 Tax=Burkholderia gladioli TaxID=28095 RepID=UPI003D2464D2
MGVDAGEIEDYYLAILSLNGYADVTVGGRRMIIGQDAGHGGRTLDSLQRHFSADCEQFFVRIDKRAMLAHTGYDHLHIEPALDLSRPELAPWLPSCGC